MHLPIVQLFSHVRYQYQIFLSQWKLQQNEQEIVIKKDQILKLTKEIEKIKGTNGSAAKPEDWAKEIQCKETHLARLREEETSHQVNIAEKKLHKNQSKLMEFKALEAYGESFPQFVLQLTIIIKNGLHIFDGEVIKIFSIVSSYITLILTVSGLIVSLPFYIDGKKRIQEKTMKLQYKTVLPKVTFIVTSRLVILCLFLSMFDLDSAWLCSTILAIFVLSYFFLYWILFKLQLAEGIFTVVIFTVKFCTVLLFTEGILTIGNCTVVLGGILTEGNCTVVKMEF